MTDHDPFLLTILDAPQEDAPRLVYADWLLERGQLTPAVVLPLILDHPECDALRLLYAHACENVGEGAKGEFVRCQVELAKTPEFLPSECDVCGNVADETGTVEHGRGCYVVDSDGGGTSAADENPRFEELRRRERELWDTWAEPGIVGAMANRSGWGNLPGQVVAFSPSRVRTRASYEDIEFTFRRGFPSVVSLTTAALLGVCEECGRGEYETGSVCPRCSGTGRTAPLAPVLAGLPLEEVTLTDCAPYETDEVYPSIFQWIEQTRREFDEERRDGGTPTSAMGSLHKYLFKLLTPHPMFVKRDEKWNKEEPDDRRLTYPTEPAATLALSRAAAAYCRGLRGSKH